MDKKQPTEIPYVGTFAGHIGQRHQRSGVACFCGLPPFLAERIHRESVYVLCGGKGIPGWALHGSPKVPSVSNSMARWATNHHLLCSRVLVRSGTPNSSAAVAISRTARTAAIRLLPTLI